MKWSWLPFKSLRTGLLITYVLLIATSLGLMAWRIGTSLDASRLMETRLDQQGRAILAASAAGDWILNYREGRITESELQDEVRDLSEQIHQQIGILDTEGKIFIEPAHPWEVGRDDSKNPEIISALAWHPESDIRYDPDAKGDAIFSASPIIYQRQLVGVVRLELSMDLVRASSQAFWLRIIGVTFLAGFVTVLVSLFFARTLTEPLAQMTRATTLMANGDLKPRVTVSGPEELQKLAASFNSMAGRVSRVMEEQRAFVANAAHELRTPLTTIRLRAEALREGAKDDPQVAARFLADIESETDRLAHLVDDLLNLSRIETGLTHLRREPVSVPQVARVVVEKLAPRANEKNITLHIQAREDLPAVQADPRQIQQVLINLIGNAIKYTPQGGAVWIELEMVKRSDVFGLSGADDYVLTRVRDTGPGIVAEDLSHVFERFYRGDKARAREEAGVTTGTGLGLAIVKGIIDAHRGRVWAENGTDRGAIISFVLPISR
jgi:signal transduction histidine kinase